MFYVTIWYYMILTVFFVLVCTLQQKLNRLVKKNKVTYSEIFTLSKTTLQELKPKRPLYRTNTPLRKRKTRTNIATLPLPHLHQIQYHKPRYYIIVSYNHSIDLIIPYCERNTIRVILSSTHWTSVNKRFYLLDIYIKTCLKSL